MIRTERPAAHGRDHTPEGADAVYAGPWYYVGAGGMMPDGSPVPDFQNGWHNIVGTDDPVPLRFRILLGPPNLLLPDGTVDEDSRSTSKDVQVQGDIDGGGDGTVVFSLPPSYRLDYDVPMGAHDSSMMYVACRLYKNGDFVRGTP
jgi:hypothetical protein